MSDKHYPHLSWVGRRVRVCHNYDTRETWCGYIIHDDGPVVIRLDDGREVRAADGWQYQLIPIDSHTGNN